VNTLADLLGDLLAAIGQLVELGRRPQPRLRAAPARPAPCAWPSPPAAEPP